MCTVFRCHKSQGKEQCPPSPRCPCASLQSLHAQHQPLQRHGLVWPCSFTLTVVGDHILSLPFAQVVLPVLGHSIQYPENRVGQWFQDALRRDGLQTCRFRVPALKLNVPGCYRQILKHPHNLSYQLMEEQDIDGKTEGPHTDGATLSLSISFDLDASCYATVCLREVMKHDF